MPQLEKGGKYVFGISLIGTDGSFTIPPEALAEYGYQDGDTVFLMNGSCTTGGFGITVKRNIEKSKIKQVFQTAPGLMDCTLPEAEIIRNHGRSFCWTVILPGGIIRLPEKTLAVFGAKPGGKLGIFRGSNFAIGCGARGPIWQLAVKHPALPVF
jgi:hypothetical protein